MKFNEKLLDLRKQKGWSQEELGNELNVSRQTISKWEMGMTTPELENLIMLSKIFDISIDELVDNVKIEEDKVEEIKEDYSKNVRKNNKKNKILWIIVIIIFILCGIAGSLIYRSQIIRYANLNLWEDALRIAHTGGNLEIQTYEITENMQTITKKTRIYKYDEALEESPYDPYVSQMKIQEFLNDKIYEEIYINLDSGHWIDSGEFGGCSAIKINYENNTYEILKDYKFQFLFTSDILAEFKSMFNVEEGYGGFYEALKLENQIFNDNRFYYVSNEKINTLMQKDFITLKIDKTNNWFKLVSKEYNDNKKASTLQKVYIGSDIVSKKDVELPDLSQFTLIEK